MSRRREETRRKLIHGALSVMAKKGIEAATIQEITDAADVGFGSFYNHFDSKEAILEATVAERVQPWIDSMEAMEAQCDDPAESLAAFIRHALKKGLNEPTWGWFVVRTGQWMTKSGTGLGRRLSQGIESGSDSGRFCVPSPTVAALAVTGSLLALLAAMLEGKLNKRTPREAAALALIQLGVPDSEAREIAARRLPRLPPFAGEGNVR